jgi:hypothetical protein
MGINKEQGNGGDLDRSSWEGMGGAEIDSEIAMFVFTVQRSF